MGERMGNVLTEKTRVSINVKGVDVYGTILEQKDDQFHVMVFRHDKYVGHINWNGKRITKGLPALNEEEACALERAIKGALK